jgi:hypothetical protein
LLATTLKLALIWAMEPSAREFAIMSHGAQKYGIKPYEAHLQHVNRILRQTLLAKDPNLSAASWLHDVVEDTSVTLEEIKIKFGPEVADIVWRVTDEVGRTRKERKIKTYPKIKGHRGATIIKLCDRIANVEASITLPEKLKMYSGEYAEFRLNLYVPGVADSLWRRLAHTLQAENDSEWKFNFWVSDAHGLIRVKKRNSALFHPEVVQNEKWKFGSPYVLDAITGMGEDPYSCGEHADEIDLFQAIELAEKAGVDLFEVNSP